MTWPLFLSAEHWTGYVSEAPEFTVVNSFCSYIVMSFVSGGKKMEIHFRDSILITHILLDNIKIHKHVEMSK